MDHSSFGGGPSNPTKDLAYWQGGGSVNRPYDPAVTACLRRLAALGLAALLAACSGTRGPSSPAPAPVPGAFAPSEAGRAAFFFPVAVPLAEVGRIVEATLPPRMSDERKAEISGALEDDFYRYALERGPVAVGFADGRLSFAFAVHGRLTIGGRLRPLGLPVEQTVEIAARVHGTAAPAITPAWQPDPRPSARIDVDRADLQVLRLFSVSVRGFLQDQLDPVLDRELQRAAGRLLADLALRRKAEAAWRSLHVARRVADGETLWIRFQPMAISLAPVTVKDAVLHTGFGITGMVSLGLGSPLAPPPVALLPPLGRNAERAGGFEVEVPVAAPPAELSRWVDAALRGMRFRAGRDREFTIRSASLGAEGDRLLLTLAFATGGRDGTLILRGRPALDPGTSVLRLADLDYDLDSGSLFLKLANRLHRTELLARLQKAAHLDLAPLLARADRETARAVRGLLPAGLSGEVRIEPVHVLGVGVAGGQVWARCRVAGAISAAAFQDPAAAGAAPRPGFGYSEGTTRD
jgi:hypothetical protein